MLCDVCKRNEAGVKVVKVHNGKEELINICFDCLKRGGNPIAEEIKGVINNALDKNEKTTNVDKSKISDPLAVLKDIVNENSPIQDTLNTLTRLGIKEGESASVNLVVRNNEKNDAEDVNLVCPNCGLTKEEYDKNGVFGCASCVEIFVKDTNHKGKIPKTKNEDMHLESMLLAKEEELKKLVFEEEFEKAAILRDEINVLKQRMGSND